MQKILLQDCLKYMKTVEDDTFDCVVTSPPYNKGGLGNQNAHNWDSCINYDNYVDDIPQEEYEQWQVNILNELYRCIKPTGSVFYNHKIVRRNGICEFPKFIFNSKFNLYQMIIWDRGNTPDVGNRHLLPTTELIFWLVKDKPNVYRENAIYRSEVWKFPPTKKNDHPASFPLDLPYNCILLTTKENDYVYDPFVGSGTTGVACKKLNRNFVGTDISEKYVKLAENNIIREITNFKAEEQNKKRLF